MLDLTLNFTPWLRAGCRRGTLSMTFCLGDSRAALDYDYRYKTARLSQTVADTVTNNSGCRRHAGRRRLRVCLVVLKLPVVEIHRQLFTVQVRL